MNTGVVSIRETTAADLDDIMQVEILAFGQDEEAKLVSDLLNDKTAKPCVSILAFVDKEPVGHILFTRVYFDDLENQPLMHILVPLAVIPKYQGKGIGGKLVNKGLEIIRARETELVFVLGHENYYPKYGFIPNAGKFGFTASYPIAEENANAWMFQYLGEEKGNRGKIKCADKLSKPEYWEE